MLRTSRVQSFHNKINLAFIIAGVFVFWYACGGTPERNTSIVNIPRHGAEETPTPHVTIIEVPEPTQTPTPAPEALPKHQLGFIVRHPNTLDSTEWIDLASKYHATHIQIGGETVKAVEDLIFNADLQIQVRRVARQAEQENLKVYVWSRELNLGDGLFRFDSTDPFYAARQAAYRNVLKLLPEIDGFVLQFVDAQSPPWSAVADPSAAPPEPIERIRFVIDMIKSVVVDEMNKDLWVRVGDEGTQAIEWISSAIKSISSPNVGVILTQPTWLSAEYSQRAWIAQQFKDAKVMLESDATMEAWGGANGIVSFAQPLEPFHDLNDSYNFDGFSCAIDTANTLIFDSPNRSNLTLLYQRMETPAPPNSAILQQWIENEFKFAPITREGILIKDLFIQSWGIAQRGYEVENNLNFSFLWDVNNPPFFHHDELNLPTQQTLINMAQSSDEAKTVLEKQLAQLEDIQFNLDFTQLSSLEQGIKNQINAVNILHYAKQCFWGYQLWKQTRSENEALILEGHLHALQSITGTMSQSYSINNELIDAGGILTFISHIRSNFPRVLFGAHERIWNKIRNVQIHQSAMDTIEVLWETQEPSIGKCYITSIKPPIWDKSAETSLFPETQHRVVLNGLQSGQSYSITISIQLENGIIIYSKDHIFSLDQDAVF